MCYFSSVLALQQYDIELRYKKGEQNSAADCLLHI